MRAWAQDFLISGSNLLVKNGAFYLNDELASAASASLRVENLSVVVWRIASRTLPSTFLSDKAIVVNGGNHAFSGGYTSSPLIYI